MGWPSHKSIDRSTLYSFFNVSGQSGNEIVFVYIKILGDVNQTFLGGNLHVHVDINPYRRVNMPLLDIHIDNIFREDYNTFLYVQRI